MNKKNLSSKKSFFFTFLHNRYVFLPYGLRVRIPVHCRIFTAYSFRHYRIALSVTRRQNIQNFFAERLDRKRAERVGNDKYSTRLSKWTKKVLLLHFFTVLLSPLLLFSGQEVPLQKQTFKYFAAFWPTGRHESDWKSRQCFFLNSTMCNMMLVCAYWLRVRYPAFVAFYASFKDIYLMFLRNK